MIAIVQGINRVILKKDQGERHASIASNRRLLVRSSSGFSTEPNRRNKKCRKDTITFKRFWQYGSGGAERTYIKGPRQQEAKRKLTSVKSNDLPYFRKICRREETVRPNTSDYNLRPRRGTKEESRQSSEKRTQQGGPVRSRVSPTSRSKEGQAARAPEAEEVSNNIARRGQEERTIEDPNSLW
ncbi:hypothetical protein TNCV_2012951 [Trichonephila clavipes]|uniref:Uncharacterized protein n=1 Tax=Trichonephila clavipes TaxID=2585209 RepID=A0A8X6RI62_TRICX|nr:hypothetical protein TNCV_2012951 [Trichonephila clavipes]